MNERKALKKFKKLYTGAWGVKFIEYHKKNPDIYDLFKKFTWEVIDKGHLHFGSQTVINRIRWYTDVETSGDHFKVNSNVSAYYARLFMLQFKDYNEFFRTRKVK